MDARWCGTLLVLLAICCFQRVWAQNSTPAPTQAQIDKQVEVNRTTLLDGKDEQTRVYAATLLLFGENGEARKELLTILRDPNRPVARAAICKALISARENKRPIPGKGEFVEPVMAVLSTENDSARAELAAQALLIFTYETIQRRLDDVIADTNAPDVARVNAIRALKYQPDDRAVFTLMNLLSSPHPGIAAESQQALALLGIKVTDDPNEVQALSEDLRRRGPEAYLNNPGIMRNWLVSRENRIRELATAVTSWEQRYMAALGRLYDVQADEKARSEFLAQQLNSAEPSVKLWALGKLEEIRRGTGKTKLSEQVESVLLSLVSHRDKRVRLKTGSLLSLMWELNSTTQLLDQLQVEEDPEVRHGLFVALGNVCYYASLPTSGVNVPEEVRRRTLELAMRFLDLPEAHKTRSGADVIWRLLEQDGLKPEEIDKYLTALARRYQQATPASNHGLRAELLGAMARLCAERSKCRVQAAKLYGPVFEKALADELEPVRQAALDGLTNISKALAMNRARAGLLNDSSQAIREKVTALAGEVGGQEDLPWLSKRLATEGEGPTAWQAMLKILRRSTGEVAQKWAADLEADPSTLSDAQRIELFSLLEQKAQSENKLDGLREARKKLFSLHIGSGNAAQASAYGNQLWEAGKDDREKRRATADLVQICLRAPNPPVDLIGSMVERYLSEQDLGPESPIAASIDAYLKKPLAASDPNALLARLRRIKIQEPDTRALWRKQLLEWETFAKAKRPEQAEKVNN